jgi:signal peptidase I
VTSTLPAVKGLRRVVDWLVTIAVAVGIVLVFEAEIAKPYRVPSPSMEPTLHCAKPTPYCEGSHDDRVIANRLAYRFSKPKRGQVVVFHAPARARKECGEGGTYVKRLIGLPGDSIVEREGRLTINGKPLREPYVRKSLRDMGSGWWTVPKGHYFFMGDDRLHSCDSRNWGSVPRSSLIGPVLFTYWPPNRWF